MKFCTADAGILIFLVTLFTSISPVFAQSNLNDTLAQSRQTVHIPIDFESVAKRLKELSEPAIALPQRDSIPQKIQQRLRKDILNTHGHIDLSYAYGLNTVFVDTSRSIGSIFNAFGEFSTSVLGLPVNLSFNYSTLKVPLGTNNYFRFSLDKKRLIEQQKQKLTGSLADLEGQQAKLREKQGELSGLMGSAEVYLDQLKRLAAREAEKQKSALNKRVQDSIATRKSQVTDSLNSRNYKQPELQKKADYQLYYDSLMRVYERMVQVKNSYDSLSGKLSSSKELLSSQLGQLDFKGLVSKGLSKTGLLESIRTLDLGLTYPKTTALSGQNVPLKGIHAEIQYGKVYLSFASGLTLNNIMLSTNEIQNQLNYSQNVFNNFDFQQIKNNGWLTAVKTGYGTVDGTHAFVGFNYLTNTRFLNPAGSAPVAGQTSYDPAASLELDLRYVPRFIKGSAFDLVYGKTSMNSQLDTNQSPGVFQTLFSGYPSHVLLGKYTQSLSKLRSDFSISYRRLDAFANTTTFGTMQPNNERLEVKTNHKINRFVKLGLLYRRDATLRAISGMNNLRLNVAGATVSGNYTSYLSYSVFVNYVRHVMQLPLLPITQKGNNYLVGFNVSSNYDLGRAKATSALTYNDYLLTDTAKVNKYTQFGLMQVFAEKTYSLSVSYDYFFRRIDGVSSGTSVFGAAGKYILKKVSLGAGLKLASDSEASMSLGGHVEATWRVNRFLDLSARAERFVLGNFYRSYYRIQYDQFPYLISFQTRFKL